MTICTTASKTSATYLKEKLSSGYEATTNMEYVTRTHVSTLSLADLLEVDNPGVFDHKEATHVVTRIVYGATAIMKFSKFERNTTKRREVQGKLKATATFIVGMLLRTLYYQYVCVSPGTVARIFVRGEGGQSPSHQDSS